MSKHVFTACVVMLVSSALPVAAQHRIRESTKLEVSLETGQIVDKTTGRGYPMNPKGTTFIVSGGVETAIAVVDTNALLFEYSANKTSAVSSEYADSESFAGVLQKLLAAFPASGAGDRKALTIEGFDPVALREYLDALSDEIDGIPARLRESIGGDAGVKQLKEHFSDKDRRALADVVDAQYVAMFKVAQRCLDGAQTTLTVDGHAIDCDAPYKLDLAVRRSELHAALLDAAEHAAALAVEARRADDEVTRARAAIKPGNKLNAAQKKAQDLAQRDLAAAEAKFAAASDAAKKAETQRAAAEQKFNDSAAPIEAERRLGRTLRQFMALALAMDGRVQKETQLYRDLLTDVDGVRRPFAAGTHDYSVKDVQTTTITIKAKKKWQAFMPADVKAAQDARIGSVAVITDAYRPVHVSVGPAFVLGFIKNPTFKAVKDGDAYKIVRSEEELTRYDVAAMLNLTPDQWREPTFGGFFQLGVSPKKDGMGFYFGGGIRSHGVFTFGAGFMMQQVRKLGDGLTDASRLASPDDLKTGVTFKPGLYLHVTVELMKK